MDPISNLINDKADELFPTDANSSTTPPTDEVIDLEDYSEENKEEKPETEPEKLENKDESKAEEPALDKADSPIDLKQLKTRIYSIKDQLDAVIRMIEGGKISEKDLITKEETPKEESDNIIFGFFDGEKMISKDAKEYSIPPNYASKSKMVEGDELKLIIANSGKFIYKQIKPTERVRKIGLLAKDPANEQWCVKDGNHKYKVLTASVTFYKGTPGDEVVFFIAKDRSNSWAAVDNIVKKSF